MKEVFLLEHYKRYGMDDNSGIVIEDSIIVGYFTTQQQLNQAVLRCKDCAIPKEELRVYTYPLDYGTNQKNVYVLMYEYTLLEQDGLFDYNYLFAPRTSAIECRQYKEALLQEDEYKPFIGKEYRGTADGFSIRKIPLDHVFAVSRFE